jgi:transposase-like protein
MRAFFGVRSTEGILDFCTTIAISIAMAQENEASSSSFAKTAIPRCKLGTRMERWNYYTVRRGYNCGLYLNWLDCECKVKGFSSA